MSAKKVISKQPWINDENMVVGEVTFYGDGTSIEEFYDHIGPIEGPNHMFRSENFSLLEENGFQYSI